jgi:glycosyltransferase involved in cell wall biosynthesis
MTLSVIIPCYNCGVFLRDAIESVLLQDFPGKEVIVVDDGSTDGSADFINDFASVKLIRQSNAGVSAARNAGLKVALGSLVAFLDADDRLLEGALTALSEAFSRDRKLVMAFGGNRIVDAHGTKLYTNFQPPSQFDFWDVILGVAPGPSQCMFRRSAIEQIGGFDTNLKLMEDWALYLELAKLGTISSIGRVVSDYRRHTNQASRAPSKMLKNVLSILKSQEDEYPLLNKDHALRFRLAREHWKVHFGKGYRARRPETC